MVAAISGHTEEVSNLLKVESNIDEKSKFGWTALVFSSKEGHFEVVNKLLEAGADPNTITQKVPAAFETTGSYPETTALAESIKYNKLEVAELLVKSGAEVDVKAIALLGGIKDLSFIKNTLRNNTNINAYSGIEFYPSALCVSIDNNNKVAFDYFISIGAKVNSKKGACFPLAKAVHQNYFYYVDRLLQQGAKTDMASNNLVCEAIYTPNKDRDLNESLKIVERLVNLDALWETKDCNYSMIEKLIEGWKQASEDSKHSEYVNYYTKLREKIR